MSDPLFTSRFAPLVIRELGLDEEAARALVADSGLPEEALEGAYTAPLSRTREFLSRAVGLARDPNLGLRVAASAPPGMFGLSEMVVRTAATVDDAMRISARYYHLLNPSGRVTYEADPEYRLDYHVVGSDQGHVLNELSFAYFLRMLNLELDAPLEIVEAWFTHDREPAPLEAHFGCPVRMNMPTTGIRTTAEAVRAPMKSANPVVHAFLLEQAASTPSEEPLATLLTRVIEEQVGLEVANLDLVADAIGWTKRTLQRRLKEQELTFHQLVDGIRRRHALIALERGEAQEDVAKRVGLANAGSLRRALVRWRDPDGS